MLCLCQLTKQGRLLCPFLIHHWNMHINNSSFWTQVHARACLMHVLMPEASPVVPVVSYRSSLVAFSLMHDALKMMQIVFLMCTIASLCVKKCHGFIDQNCFVFVMIKHYLDSTMIVEPISHEWHFERNHTRNIRLHPWCFNWRRLWVVKGSVEWALTTKKGQRHVHIKLK